MPKPNTQLTLSELLADTDPIIYRSALSILKQLNRKQLQQLKQEEIRALNNLPHPKQ